MKKNLKNQRKSKGASTRRQSQPKNTTISSLELDTSLDEIFRFDDKLIGKRTNVIFEPKAAADGFYDMEYNSNLSMNTSESLSLYKGDAISEMDEKKNEKMVRMLKAIEMEESKMNLSDLSQMEKSIEQIEENENEENQNEESNLKKNSEKIFLSNNRTNQKEGKKDNSQEISTIEKHLPQENASQAGDPEKSTKSRADLSKQKKKDARRTQGKNDQKREEKQKHGRRLRSTSNQKKNEVKPLKRQTIYEKQKREIKYQTNIFMPESSVNSSKAMNPILVDARNKRQEYERKENPTQPQRNNNATLNRRRAPRDSSNQSSASNDSTQKLPMFEVILNVKRPGKNEEYKPFGSMADGLYPKRLRIPPLRYFFHERRNYAGGLLESLTLIDDAKGREVEKSILEQLENDK